MWTVMRSNECSAKKDRDFTTAVQQRPKQKKSTTKKC